MIDKEALTAIVDKVIIELEKDYLIVPKCKPLTMDNSQHPFLSLVMQFVCDQYGLIPEQVKANTRKEPVLSARNLYLYLCAKYKPLGTTFSSVGGYVGKTHSLVINTSNNMANIMSVDKTYREKITVHEEKFNELLKTTYK